MSNLANNSPSTFQLQHHLLSEGSILIEFNSNIMKTPVEIIERKGWGHPDKLADDLAEKLSQAYSNYTLDRCGAILHHNFDKLCLLGGSSKVSFGKGEMVKPIRVLINGRATLMLNNTNLDIEELLITSCRDFFSKRLPLIDPYKDLAIQLNLSTASSPGKVYSNQTSNDNPRHRWFSPVSIEDLPEKKRLHANDTSIGTGYAPLSSIEQLVLKLVDFLSDRHREDFPIWMGTDVKVMAFAANDIVDITACVPQVAQYVGSREIYVKNLEWLKAQCGKFIEHNFPQLKVDLTFNARDRLESNELYLTAIGSSIESGDEGVVGRGNRVNGLITPMRPMNVEGANGKNPVYHVGKLYNILAGRIAKHLHEEFGGRVAVNLVSRTGSNLLEPWKTIIQMERGEIPLGQLIPIVQAMHSTIPQITQEIISGSLILS